MTPKFYRQILSKNEPLIDITAKLSIFQRYNLSDYGIHGSVDGQKLETKHNTIKARYSTKYFGLSKGISVYTLFANCLPLCTKVIGANEYEGHYLLDILKSNNSMVKINAVSGDMHSVNKVNFALLYMFGYNFMPRLTNLDEKTRDNLLSFEDLNKHDKHVIKPCRKIDKDLITKESDNLLRIFATLATKKNTQANIVKKLSTHKANETLKALVEFDKIIMSIYILSYIDDEEMRRNVHRALNRVESYHQLKGLIVKVSGRKLSGRTEIEYDINNECARLLALCIIFYNASLLSELYKQHQKQQVSKDKQEVLRVSPVACQHISLIGKYEFTKNQKILDLKEIVDTVINNPKIQVNF